MSVSTCWQELTHRGQINSTLILNAKRSTMTAAGMKANSIPAKTRTVLSPHSIPSPACSGPTLSKTSKSPSDFLSFDKNTETAFPYLWAVPQKCPCSLFSPLLLKSKGHAYPRASPAPSQLLHLSLSLRPAEDREVVSSGDSADIGLLCG